MLEIVSAILLLIGGIFLFVGSLGLLRLPDFMMRLHGPTKATTLGIGSVLIACMLSLSQQQVQLSVHELMITLFLFITAPITAHMLAKSALHLELPWHENTRNTHLGKTARDRLPPESQPDGQGQ